MWIGGVRRQIREGRRYWKPGYVLEEGKRVSRKYEAVEYVLSLVDVRVLLEAWSVPVEFWARMIDLWECLVPAISREWTNQDVKDLEAVTDGY